MIEQVFYSTRPKVLIVDDRRENIYALERTLETLHVDIYSALTGNEALVLLLHHHFAVALLDVQMPEMDGFELATLMRGNSATRQIPIIFITAISKEPRHVFRGYESGAVDYLFKPVEAEILLSKVRVFCQIAEQQQELALEVERRRTIEVENIALIEELQDTLAEREAANQQLELARDRLTIILDSMQAGVMVMDDETHVIAEANPTLASMLGLPREALIGRHCCEFLCPKKRGDCEHCEFEHMEESSEGTLRDADGNEISVLRAAVSLLLGDKKHYVANFLDITELKRLEKEMFQAQKLEGLGVLAGGIAHDFNNLLMGILGNVELALMETPAQSKSQRYLERTHTCAMRAADLTRLMLAYSGRGNFEVIPLNLSTLVEEMVRLLEVAVSKSVRLVCRLEREIPAVEADATQLRQVVMNLITNASEAIGERDGQVTLTTGVVELDERAAIRIHAMPPLTCGAWVYISVADTGHGMTPETLDRIFDPFFTTKFTGRGLGLSALQGIIRGHGGAIEVRSTFGQGSEFRVFLPRSDKAVLEPREQKHRIGDWRGTGTILVVDDEESVRQLTRSALERFGYTVLTAENGQNGLAVFEAHARDIACVLLDLTMPVMNGIETYRQIRKLRDDICVILCSGFTEEDAARQFSESGLAGFLQKPYRLRTLREKLEALTPVLPYQSA